MSHSNAYPQNWSNCNCPPADSVEPNGNYYRAVEHSPSIKEDFQKSVEAGKFLKASPCDRLAVSLLGTREGAVLHLKLFPWKENWFIAEVSLNSGHGRVKDTPNHKQPAHVDWWPFPDVVREQAVTNVRKP